MKRRAFLFRRRLRGGTGAGIIKKTKEGSHLRRHALDFMLIAAVLLIAALLWLRLRPVEAGAAVQVLQDGEEISR